MRKWAKSGCIERKLCSLLRKINRIPVSKDVWTYDWNRFHYVETLISRKAELLNFTKARIKSWPIYCIYYYRKRVDYRSRIGQCAYESNTTGTLIRELANKEKCRYVGMFIFPNSWYRTESLFTKTELEETVCLLYLWLTYSTVTCQIFHNVFFIKTSTFRWRAAVHVTAVNSNNSYWTTSQSGSLKKRQSKCPLWPFCVSAYTLRPYSKSGS